MAFPSVDPSAFGAMPAALSQGFTMPTGGMFGGGGNDKLKQALLAAVAGFMARRSPGVSSNIIGGLQDAQTLKQRLAMAQQERQQQMQDQRDEFTFEQDYKRNHPLPTQPAEQERLISRYMDPSTPPAEREVIGQVLMPPTLQMVNGSLVSVPRTPQSVPTAPVGKLTPLGAGGPTPSASGGFLGAPYSDVGPYHRY